MNRNKSSVITQLRLIMRFTGSSINAIDIIISMEDQSSGDDAYAKLKDYERRA